MKRDDLKKLNLEDAVIDSIMALHGTDIEKHKTGLDEQIKKIRESESDNPTPKIVTGGSSHSVLADPVIEAARKAAGAIKEKQKDCRFFRRLPLSLGHALRAGWFSRAGCKSG